MFVYSRVLGSFVIICTLNDLIITIVSPSLQCRTNSRAKVV